MPQPPGALSPAASTSLEQLLSSVEPLLGRCRPVSRVRQQFLIDLAALLTGLRAAVMLDYAPGATPPQLLALLQPLARQQPPAAGFAGCVLHLEGCCYLTNLAQLSQRLSGWAADPADWPLIVGFQAGQLAAVEPADELQQQLQALAAAVQQQLASQEQLGSAGPASSWGLLDLGRVSGLPAMPTLNGLLLGYPCVYWVRDLQEAGAASRALSMARLRLCRVEGSCAAAGGGPPRALLAFTVPDELCGERLDCSERLDRSVQVQLRHMQAANKATGCCWSGLRCCAEEVEGPRAISL